MKFFFPNKWENIHAFLFQNFIKNVLKNLLAKNPRKMISTDLLKVLGN